MANKSSRNTRKKTTRNRRKSSKVNLAIVAVIGVTCIGMLIANKFLGDKSDKTKETDGKAVVTEAVTMPPKVEVSPTAKPSETPTQTPVSATPAPTKQPEEVTPTPDITVEKAKELVEQAVNDSKYTIELASEELSIEGTDYYQFRILLDNKKNGPGILVTKDSGSLYYYDESGIVTPFTKFPLDKVETVEETETKAGIITEKEAVEKVSKLSKEDLGLKKDLKDYTIEVDAWTSVINGDSSYCLNVFEETPDGKQLVGVFYVTVDGEKIYKQNEETQEFSEIQQ